jgi:hypothetical protein
MHPGGAPDGYDASLAHVAAHRNEKDLSALRKKRLASAAPMSPAMAWISTLAQTQKSFGSFLQKRTRFTFTSDKRLREAYRDYRGSAE